MCVYLLSYLKHESYLNSLYRSSVLSFCLPVIISLLSVSLNVSQLSFTVCHHLSLSLTSFSVEAGPERWIRSGSDSPREINGFPFSPDPPRWIWPWAKDLYTEVVYLKPWMYYYAETMMMYANIHSTFVRPPASWKYSLGSLDLQCSVPQTIIKLIYFTWQGNLHRNWFMCGIIKMNEENHNFLCVCVCNCNTIWSWLTGTFAWPEICCILCHSFHCYPIILS